MENFSGYQQYAQNTLYNPTPMRPYGLDDSMPKSPDFYAAPQAYSPLCGASINQFYQINQCQSPVINLMQCQQPSEDMINSENPINKKQNTPCLKMRQKLNSRSKAFVKKDIDTKNDRKASSDTKAHTEDEGNTSEDSDNSNLASPIGLAHNKSMITNNFSSPNHANLILTEKPQTSFVTKFKTELCKNWQVGDCKFGSKCAFAHGFDELSTKKNLPSNYKTRICKQFHEEMYCSYGARCQFIHLKNEVEGDKNILSQAINSLARLRSGKRAPKGRLNVFKNLTN